MSGATVSPGKGLLGQPAPPIELPQVGGGTWKLADQRGSPVLLILHRHLV